MEMAIVQIASNDKPSSEDQYLLYREEYDLLGQAPLKLKEEGSLYGEYPWTLVTLAEAKARVKAYTDTISDSWAQLQRILERRESALRKRWLKKTKEQRTKILLAAWPGMPKRHRPDFQAILKRRNTTATSSIPVIDTALSKWPFINLEDLVHGKTLLLFLNSRGRNPPEVFAYTDMVSTWTGRLMDYLRVVGLAGYTMLLKGGVSDGRYGRIVPVQTTEHNSLWQYDAGEGLLVLEIQAKILTFLLRCCHQIFHDVSPEEIASTTLPVQPSPEPLATNSASYLQMTEAAAEVPYKAPTHLDTSRLVQLIEARRTLAEEHVLDLREDPGYFVTTVSELVLHLEERDLLCIGRTDPSHATEHWTQALLGTVDEAYTLLTLWDTFYQKASKLNALAGGSLAKFDPTKPLPDDLQTAISDLACIARYLKSCFLAFLVGRVSTSPEIRTFLSKVNYALTHDKFKYQQTMGKAQSDESLLLFSLMFNKIHKHELDAIRVETVVDELQRIFDKYSEQRNRLTFTTLACFSNLALVCHIIKEIAAVPTWTSTFRSKSLPTAKTIPTYEDGSRIRETLSPVTNPLFGQFMFGTAVPRAKELYYPSEKARTQINVEAMIAAEKNLDAFWENMDELLQTTNGESLHQMLLRLSGSSRDIHRTPPWQVKESHPAPTAISLPPDLSHLAITDEEGEPPVVQRPRTKVKTRGSPLPVQGTDAPQAPPAPNDANSPAVDNLSKRALKVFKTMFHTSSNDGQREVDWKDFLHAMTAMGFAAEKLYGSVWHFTPTETAGGRSINVHEPHPTGKIPFYTARRIGARLSRTYGWTGEMFTSD